MRLLLCAACFALCVPAAAWADKDQPSAGKTDSGPLKLIIEADQAKTRIGPNGLAEPVRLKMTFKNVSDKPLKLDLYDWRESRGTWKITGPQPVETKPVRDKKLPTPDSGDFPTLAPGGSITFNVHFPERFGFKEYLVRTPGKYQMAFHYSTGKPVESYWATGAWQGAAVSNTLELEVAPAE
jgi:hypothetical protein